MRNIPPPSIIEQLVPVLACLPTAFVSPQPPPALLPYLSPILRQRLSLLSSRLQPNNNRSANTHNDSNWLHLLTWSSANARRLNDIVSELQLEPHPVSGEIELFEDDLDGDQGRIRYRRADEETLQAKCDVPQHRLSVVWVWCTNDTGGVGVENAAGGEAKDGWRVAELLPCEGEDAKAASEWCDTLEAAEEVARARAGIIDHTGGEDGAEDPVLRNGAKLQKDEEDDDDYWASYDRSPGRTPSKRSPAPRRGPFPLMPGQAPAAEQASAEERDYFESYGGVQPAMDAHDPDEAEQAETHESTLQQSRSMQQYPEQEQEHNGEANGMHYEMPAASQEPPPPLGLGMEAQRMDAGLAVDPAAAPAPRIRSPSIHSPTASRPSSREHSPVARLEASAESSSVAEVGVKQHISTEMKSLYRLARSMGIERDEFERVVQRELQVLDLLEY